ncbi:MAG: ATP-binding protein [Porphyrobacter sp.]|nr:ATP-binding protein [Porphyrobacter sp.]
MTTAHPSPLINATGPLYDEVPWAEAPLDARLKRLGELVVARDIENRITSVFDYVRHARKLYTEPRNVVVFGEPGVGKSDIMARYLEANKAHQAPNGDIKRPVLLIELQNSATPASVARQMLIKLGVGEEFQKLSTTRLSDLLKRQMIGQGVEIAIIDEFHNTLTDNGAIRLDRVAEWVKDLSKRKERTSENPYGSYEEVIPFVMVGTRKVRNIVDPSNNSQLFSITPRIIEIDRYHYTSSKEKRTFQSFLIHLDSKLPFDESSELGTKFADQLHIASFGLLRPLAHIVTFAAELALEEGTNRIHEHHLHDSVEEQRAVLQSCFVCEDATKEQLSRVVTNPFKPSVLLRPAIPRNRVGYKLEA